MIDSLAPIVASCSTSTIAQGSLWDAFWCPVTDPTGLGMAGVVLIIAFTGASALFGYTRDLTAPGAWLALVLGMVVATVPGAAATRIVGIVTAVAIIGGIAIWNVLRR